jgi:predicted transcriptional regulator
VERDVKSVCGDVQSFLNAGVLGRTGDEQVEFPYDEVHIDLVVRTA